MDNLCKTFAKNLKTRRLSLGYTQKDLADQINYSTKAISKWEAAHALPPTSLLPTLAKILQASVDELLSPPPVIKYYLGIAGYDEQCDLLLCDIEGNVLKSLTVETLNPTLIGLDKMTKRLTDALFRIAGDLRFGEISVSVGIDGIYRFGKSELKMLLHGLGFTTVRVLSNSRNSIEAALGDSVGVFVNLGYGSIVFAKPPEPPFLRIGGYGYLFDEPFSAFTLGKDAVRAVFLSQDGIGEPTRLEKLIREKMNIFEGSLPPVLFSDRMLICRLAEAVFSAYAEGDRIAERILRKNAEDISVMINAAANKLKTDVTKIVLCGSLCKYRDVMIPFITQALTPYGMRFEITVCDTPAAEGALMLAGLKKTKRA